jgi:ubiquinone/menaquinone biosynthesis C-methylase UbiE
MNKPKTLIVVALVILSACRSQPKPYENGPVMSTKSIRQTFQPILDFMEYKPGMTFADIGAGSGAITVSMATLMDQSEIYIQDIDTTVLKDGELTKIINHYSSKTHEDLRARNKFHIIYGTVDQTNLPDQTFDLIYSNATTHNFTAFDSMMKDIATKLKPGGVVLLRDSFKNDHGEGEFCSDPTCGRKLLTIDEFLDGMKRNDFVMVKKNPDMSGYPVFGFKVAQ